MRSHNMAIEVQQKAGFVTETSESISDTNVKETLTILTTKAPGHQDKPEGSDSSRPSESLILSSIFNPN